MKTLAFVFSVLALSATAHADGFVCQTEDGSLVIKAYNHTDSTEGTRNAAVLVLSDPSVSAGNKTIARFTDVNEALTNVGSNYSATVDLSSEDSNLAGRNIGGTKLGFVQKILLDINFSYSAPIDDSETVSGTLTLVKLNGEELTHRVQCTRYLKAQ